MMFPTHHTDDSETLVTSCIMYVVNRRMNNDFQKNMHVLGLDQVLVI